MLLGQYDDNRWIENSESLFIRFLSIKEKVDITTKAEGFLQQFMIPQILVANSAPQPQSFLNLDERSSFALKVTMGHSPE